ncbi:MAG TPA: DUF885 family protein [Fimbriimonadaceae bacterium]|nr:DUF885 family protein [Fimbriimonadaceae bacterium]
MLLGLAACLLVSYSVKSDESASYKLASRGANSMFALQGNPMRELIERYESDRSALARFFPISISPSRAERFKKLYADTRSDLNGVNFGGLDADGKLDWVLTENMLTYNERRLELDEKERLDAVPFVPFEKDVIEMAEARQRMEKVDGQAAAARLDKIRDAITEKQKALDKDLADKKKFDKPVIFRAAALTDQLRGHLREWFEFYKGYDPVFTWWCAEPHKKADEAIVAYAKFLREKVIGLKPDDKDAIVGDPVGEARLMEDLRNEFIPYTPAELIAIAEKEYAWCEAEMKKASREMGFGDDWRKALEKVKTLHVAPGEQPNLIREQALEAIEYVEKHELVTVPPLAKETWRMNMMSPERQKVSPFFLGGETIMVSFPTDTMSHDEKLMSLRANNIHFARATVHHELIPGHHLQQFMNQRHKPYRRSFSTPFWTEGWALWFEFLLWDLGFPLSPENKVGMLFWRMHRCVRIVFSLSFHLGKMTPEECIKMLVDRVGHEQSTAEGEVRRSFGGQYPPLYQAAYMLGALQFKAMAKEMVGPGKMTYRQFHDAILKEHNIPVAALRAKLRGLPIEKGFDPKWRFYDN